MGRYMKTSEYAERMGMSEYMVRKHCRDGDIEGAVLIGNQWRIPEEDVPPTVSMDRMRDALDGLIAAFQELKEALDA